jgi:hypothetical protein
MINVARLYNCQRCNVQITICRHCDHGNRYCMECAPVAHQEARKRAAVRYQDSQQGRLNHAARQSQYRERQKKKVTHKGSKVVRISDLLIDGRKKNKLSSIPPAQKIFSTNLLPFLSKIVLTISSPRLPAQHGLTSVHA